MVPSSQTETNWVAVAIVGPILWFGLILAAGFGVGTSCTNDGMNRTLDTPPCDGVNHAATFNSVVQPVLLVAAIATARLMAHPRRSHQLLTAVSVAFGIASFVWMLSY